MSKSKDIEHCSPFNNVYTQHLRSFPIVDPETSLNRLVSKELKRYLLPKRKCALKECGKEFRPEKENDCCCSKEHFIKLKEKSKRT